MFYISSIFYRGNNNNLIILIAKLIDIINVFYNIAILQIVFCWINLKTL